MAELPGMVLERPFDERLREPHTLALHGAGRQADALAVYREARRVLNEQLGMEPGVGLREAHRRVLAPDQPSPRRQAPKIPMHAAAGSAVAGVRPVQLPARVEHLAGRSAELDILLAGAERRRTPAAHVDVVHSMPGIGKSALAVTCAHLLAPEFPDCQLYIDLRGSIRAADPPTRRRLARRGRTCLRGGRREPGHVRPRRRCGHGRTVRLLVVLQCAQRAGRTAVQAAVSLPRR